MKQATKKLEHEKAATTVEHEKAALGHKNENNNSNCD